MAWRDNVLWLAGWLEGEGSFTTSEVGSKHGKFCQITAGSIDHDTALHATQLLDGKIYGPYQYPCRLTKNRKPMWQVRVAGTLAASWMMILFPFMGTRRQKQIKSCLAGWRALGTTPHSIARHWVKAEQVKARRKFGAR